MPLLLAASCGTSRKIDRIRRDLPSAAITLPSRPLPKVEIVNVPRDTVRLIDPEGREVILMDAVYDEQSGEMVATEELQAACVVARFKNVAERHGEVDLEFLVVVSDSLQDSHWQLRFCPTMYLQGDTVDLAPVYITGEEFRRAQLRGYNIYSRYLESISRDSLWFVDESQVRTLLQRDSYGIPATEVREHYTRDLMVWLNSLKVEDKDRRRRRYIRNPIDPDTVRVDSVQRPARFVYTYVQTIKTRPGLRKADVVLHGGIYDEERCLYRIPEGEPVTFYISSVSSFMDPSPRFKTKIVERRVLESQHCDIAFRVGSSVIDTSLGRNASELLRVRHSLESILADDDLVTDSIVVRASCSPDGSYAGNSRLAERRASSALGWLRANYPSQAEEEAAFAVDETGAITRVEVAAPSMPPMYSRPIAENWPLLDSLVRTDPMMRQSEKAAYMRLSGIRNVDERESRLGRQRFWPYVKAKHFPQLRYVCVEEYLHRKGMVKDTIHTTVLDTLYMDGLKALEDRDYTRALEILAPYADFNTAVAYLSLDFNASAEQILLSLPGTACNEYMLALVCARREDASAAADHFLKACAAEPSYRYRGNLDPEIAAIIRRFSLDDYFSSLEGDAASFL